MARLYKRKGSPLWYARWTDAAGVNQRESTRTVDRKLAEKFLQARVADAVYRRAGLEALKPVALADAVGEYLELHRPPVWAPKWWDTAKRWWQARIQDDLGGPETPVAQIAREHAERARAKWLREVQPPTVNRISAVASGFFKWSMQQGYAERNPFLGLKRFAEVRITPAPLSEAEIASFLGAIDNPDVQRAATVAMDTGMRVSEVRRLRPGDIRGTLLHVQSSYRRGLTKNARERWVPLTARAAAAIEAQRAARGETLFECLPVNYWKAIHRAQIAAKLPRFRWHDQRHYALTRAADAGLHTHELQALAGWESPEMAKRYIHPTIARLTEAMQRVSDCAVSAPAPSLGDGKNCTGVQEPKRKKGRKAKPLENPPHGA